MSLEQRDRADISSFQIASGSGSTSAPRNHRDASGGPWKQPETLIMTPTNRIQTRAMPRDPYSRSRFETTQKVGNVTASKNLFSGQPLKRQKLSHPGASTFVRTARGTRTPFNTKGKQKTVLLGPEVITNQEIISIDDDEDIGQPLTAQVSSPDPLLLGGPRKSLPVVPLSPHPFDVLASSSRQPPDGPHTVLLRNQHQRNSVDSDPIEQYPDPPPGSVRSRINALEGLRDPPARRIDLRNPPLLKTKDRMRGKDAKIAAPAPLHKPSATESANNVLILDSFFIGLKKLPDDPDKVYQLKWDGQTRTLAIKHDHKIFISFRPRIEFDTVKYGELKDERISPIVQFTAGTPGSRKYLNPLPSEFQRGGSRGKDLITLSFRPDQPNFVTLYHSFIEFLKREVAKTARESVIGPAANHALWETAENRTQMQELQASKRFSTSTSVSQAPRSRRSDPEQPSDADELSDNFSPPPLSELSAQLPSGSKPVSRNMDSPLEIDSPYRPPPSKPAVDDDADVEISETGPRRSARQSKPTSSRKSASRDPDELILAYPPTGAVNITNGDVKRLDPGEFLNDTLIEFGLKLWLKELEEKDPVLASQFHVFSSFFYKKLNTKPVEVGYESVKKWTSRFDLFAKKYIIVPINEHLHWYLAIIYQPEHVLRPPPIKPISVPLSTRKKTRASLVTQTPEQPPNADSSASTVSACPTSPADNIRQEKEVAAMLESCSIKSSDSVRSSMSTGEKPAANGMEQADTTGVQSRAVSPLTDVDEPMEVDVEVPGAFPIPRTLSLTASETGRRMRSPSVSEMLDHQAKSPSASETGKRARSLSVSKAEKRARSLSVSEAGKRERSPTVSETGKPLSRSRSVVSVAETAVSDIVVDEAASASTGPNTGPASLFNDEVNVFSASASTSIKPTNFYGHAANKGKRKAAEWPDPAEGLPRAADGEDAEDRVSEPEIVANEQQTTYIFTLDSLGSRHPQALKTLTEYLRLEAQDKKQNFNTSRAVGKQALVPVQPNFCDCGVYLLHFAKTFMSDPARYCRTIVSRQSHAASKQRQQDWDDGSLAGFRDELATRIASLSTAWLRERAEQKAQRVEEAGAANPDGDDDSEVEVIATSVVGAKRPSPGKAQGKPRGKAARIR